MSSRRRRRSKRLGLPPYGTNVIGVDVPDKMQRRLYGLWSDGTKRDSAHFEHGGQKREEPPGGWCPGNRKNKKRMLRYQILERLGLAKPPSEKARQSMTLAASIREVLKRLAQMRRISIVPKTKSFES